MHNKEPASTMLSALSPELFCMDVYHSAPPPPHHPPSLSISVELRITLHPFPRAFLMHFS